MINAFHRCGGFEVEKETENVKGERSLSRATVQMCYLLRDAVELGEDVEERHLRDDELLLLVLVEGGSREVERQVHEGGLHHRLLVLIILQQLLFLLCRLEMEERREGVCAVQRPPHTRKETVFLLHYFILY